MKGFSKFGNAKTEAIVMTFFRVSNAFVAESLHWNPLFLSNEVSGFAISPYPFMNLLVTREIRLTCFILGTAVAPSIIQKPIEGALYAKPCLMSIQECRQIT